MSPIPRSLLVPLGLALTGAFAGGCAPAVQTQQQRLAYLKSMIDEPLRKSMSCQEVKLDFQKTEQAGIEWYDIYAAEGCGQRSDYVTQVSQQSLGPNTVTSWNASLATSESDFQAAAEGQLRKTAGFDLGCKELQFTALHTILARLRNAYESTIGVSGCGKKATYRTGCTLQGYTAGKHEITCQAMANTAPASP